MKDFSLFIRRSLWFIILVSTLTSVIAIYGYLSFIDYTSYDGFMNIQKKPAHALSSDNIILVTIDQTSEKHLNRRISDFTRSMLAKAVNNLSASGAGLIGIDLDLSKSENSKGNRALAKAIGKAGNVVLAGYIAKGKLVQPLDNFLSGADGEGLINLKIDSDGILRGMYVIFKTDKGILLSLPLYLAARYGNNKTAPHVSINSNSIVINGISIPVYKGAMLINYADNTKFNTIPYYKAVENTYDPEKVKDKIILIGNTSPLYHDYYGIPLKASAGREKIYGIQVFAASINTVLHRTFISYIYNKTTVFLIWFLIILAGVILVIIKKPVFKIAAAIAMMAVIIFVQWLLFMHGTFIPAAALYLSIPVIAFYSTGYDYLTEYRIRSYISEAFSRYVSKDVLNEIIRNPDSLRLGGEKRNITVLFSDIRGFTSIAENTSPLKLVEFLHLFFNTMTNVIYAHKGIVDKFIGDAIMAIFGAPVTDEHHGSNAVSAGAGMMKALSDLKKYSEEILHREINIGIGIHTGEAIVGNMGSDKRFDYTAIGDTVNIASRLEGLNKFFGSTCIISESTKKTLDKAVPLRQLGVVRVKGRTKGIMLYELMTDADKHFIKQYDEVWMQIGTNSPARAKILLTELLKQRPYDTPCRILLDKIDQALSTGKMPDSTIETSGILTD